MRKSGPIWAWLLSALLVSASCGAAEQRAGAAPSADERAGEAGKRGTAVSQDEARKALREAEKAAVHLIQESPERYYKLAEELAQQVGAHWDVLIEAFDDPNLHPDTRQLAAAALGYCPEYRREIVPRLFDFLHKRQVRLWYVACFVRESLVRLGVVPELAAIIGNAGTPGDTRLKALHRIRLLADQAGKATPQVLAAMEDQDLAIRRAGLLASISMRVAGKDIVAHCDKLLSDPDARVRAAIVRYLDDRRDANLPPNLALKYILEAVDDPLIQNREELLWSLPLLQNVDVMPTLRKSYASKSAAMQAVAVGVAKRLSYRDPEGASPIVAAALDNPDPIVRARGFDVVYGRNGWRIPPLNMTVSNHKLVEFLEDRTGIMICVGEDRVSDHPIPEVAAEELMRRGAKAGEIIPQLRALLAKPDRTEMAGVHAARLLGSLLGEAEAVKLYDAKEPHVLMAVIKGESYGKELNAPRLEAIFRLLRHKDPEVARAAAKILPPNWDPERLFKIARDKNEPPFLRGLAFDAFLPRRSIVGDHRVPALKEMLQDDAVVGQECGEPLPLAAKVLEVYYAPNVQELLQLLKSAAEDQRALMRRAAARRLPDAVGYGKAAEVRSILLTLLKDPAASVREAAVSALFRADPTRDPEMLVPMAQLAKMDPSAEVRRAAVQFLGYMRKGLRHSAPKETIATWTAALIGALRDQDVKVRREALGAFSDEIGTPSPEIAQALKERLEDPDPETAKWARVDLVRYRLIEDVDEPVPEWPSLSPWQRASR